KELAGVRILREQDRVMHEQMRKLVDDHVHETLVVPVGCRSARIDLERLVGLFVQRNDVRHEAKASNGCEGLKRAAGRTGGSCSGARGFSAAARASHR